MQVLFDCPPPSASATDRPTADAARLAAANINPVTGLASDYLNHFNEAIMLLEMLAAMPDCVDDFMAWAPRTYAAHFAASNFKDRELAIAAYETANAAARARLDELAETMNAILIATREALMLQLSPGTAEKLAGQAVGWLKPLVARAGGVINGHHLSAAECDEDEDDAPQQAVDALFEH